MKQVEYTVVNETSGVAFIRERLPADRSLTEGLYLFEPLLSVGQPGRYHLLYNVEGVVKKSSSFQITSNSFAGQVLLSLSLPYIPCEWVSRRPSLQPLCVSLFFFFSCHGVVCATGDDVPAARFSCHWCHLTYLFHPDRGLFESPHSWC